VNQFNQQEGTLSGVPSIEAELPEWVDCDSDFSVALEHAGLALLHSEDCRPWTWHHMYLFNLPPWRRDVIVQMCQDQLMVPLLSWEFAAELLHEALGEPEPMFGEINPSDMYDIDDDPHLPQDEVLVEDEHDYTDDEMDLGYRVDYDEDGTNWDSNDQASEQFGVDDEDQDYPESHYESEDDDDVP